MSSNSSRPRIFPIILAFMGLALFAGGARLLALGGSCWYAASGLVLIACAALLWLGNRWGSRLYGLMLLYTLVWSVWEVGLNKWALAPRMLPLIALGSWLLTPSIQKRLDSGPPPLFRNRFHASAAAWLGLGIALVAAA